MLLRETIWIILYIERYKNDQYQPICGESARRKNVTAILFKCLTNIEATTYIICIHGEAIVVICDKPYPSNSKYESHFELYPYPLSDFQKYANV